MQPIEIMKPGSFTSASGEEASFSPDLLKEIAEAYDPEVSKAPLVLGHPETDSPAHGWVEKLSYENEVLSAHASEVDSELQDYVNAGKYKKVSASFFKPEHPANPKPGTWYLKHVGFLGAAAPAVPGLKPVSLSAAEEGVFSLSVPVKAPEQKPADGDKGKGLRDLESGETQTAEKDKTLRDLELREAKLAEREKALKRSECAAFAAELRKEGKLLPAFENQLVEFMLSLNDMQTASFSAEKQETPKDFFVRYLKSQPAVVSFGESAPTSIKKPEEKSALDFAARITEIVAEAEKNGLSISWAAAAEKAKGEES